MRWRRRRQREADIERELRSDLEREASEQQERGLSAEEARYAATRALGNVALIKEEVRDMWGWSWLDRLRQDLAYAVRTFGRAPGFTTIAILTLALGIGGATAMFSVVHAVLLNPLPFANPDRLVVVFENLVDRPNDPPFFASYGDFETWKNQSRSFEHLTVGTWSGLATLDQILTGAGPARDVLAMPVGVDFFRMLGVAPQLGRTFEAEDEGGDCAVVLKHSFWLETFGGEANALGRRIQISNDACTVIGVMPQGFTFYPDAAEMWMLITPNSPVIRNPNAGIVGVFGLLKTGVSRQAAQEELELLSRKTPNVNFGARIKPVVLPLAEQFARLTGPTLRLTVIILFGAVSFVLLIGCVNVANLLIGRSVARQKEIAVRAALGSGRLRIVRQLLTEALVLSLAGAALGVLLAMAAVHYFRTLNPIAMPPGNAVSVNPAVLMFTASLAVVTALLFGSIPALRASRVDLIEGLRVSAQTASAGVSGRAVRRAMIVLEAALSLALLVGAGLLVESVQRFSSVSLGFRTGRLITMPVTLPRRIYSTNEQRARFLRDALDRTSASSSAAAFASLVPPDGGGGSGVLVDGMPEPSFPSPIGDVLQVSVSREYFKVMGIPLAGGREFDDTDADKGRDVAIVNEAFRREYLRNDSALGRRIKVLGAPGAPVWLTVVGVVGDEKHQDFFHPMSWQEPPMVFRPIDQAPPGRAFLLVRTDGNNAFATIIQKQIQSVDPNVAVSDAHSMEERLARTMSYPKFRAWIVSAFALFALLFAAIGLYAVLSQLVAQRTQEFGIRMALGAKKGDLLKLVLREGLTLTMAGIVGGLVIAISLASLLRSIIFGLKATDPLTLASGAILLALVALIAMGVPALRASRVDPKVALRCE